MSEAELAAIEADPPAWLVQSRANRTGTKPVWVQLTCSICGATESRLNSVIKIPRPGCLTISPSATSTLSASRTMFRLTERLSLSSRSLGS